MQNNPLVRQFTTAATAIGAATVICCSPADIAAYILEHGYGPMLLPPGQSLQKLQLAELLRAGHAEIFDCDFRNKAPVAQAGITAANFALAASGSVVLESTREDIRLATTLPEKHFVILDPVKILPDEMAAVPTLRRFHKERPSHYLAYITGPSRTADIERVLTIGVHGPRELHILLLPNLSDDLLEL